MVNARDSRVWRSRSRRGLRLEPLLFAGSARWARAGIRMRPGFWFPVCTWSRTRFAIKRTATLRRAGRPYGWRVCTGTRQDFTVCSPINVLVKNVKTILSVSATRQYLCTLKRWQYRRSTELLYVPNCRLQRRKLHYRYCNVEIEKHAKKLCKYVILLIQKRWETIKNKIFQTLRNYTQNSCLKQIFRLGYS